jgi:DNA-3-methyladenine glycosylase II
MNDADAITSLSKLYGIGPWSAEMFLIFQYNRQNILPTGDVGLINSFCSNYSIDKKEFLKTIAEYKKIWNPYCTVATWYLWRDIDEDIVQY